MNAMCLLVVCLIGLWGRALLPPDATVPPVTYRLVPAAGR